MFFVSVCCAWPLMSGRYSWKMAVIKNSQWKRVIIEVSWAWDNEIKFALVNFYANVRRNKFRKTNVESIAENGQISKRAEKSKSSREAGKYTELYPFHKTVYMVNKPLTLALSIQMWNELLLLPPLLYHTWNCDMLWIICNDSSFSPFLSVVLASDEWKIPVGNGRSKKKTKQGNTVNEACAKMSNFFMWLSPSLKNYAQ